MRGEDALCMFVIEYDNIPVYRLRRHYLMRRSLSLIIALCMMVTLTSCDGRRITAKSAGGAAGGDTPAPTEESEPMVTADPGTEDGDDKGVIEGSATISTVSGDTEALVPEAVEAPGTGSMRQAVFPEWEGYTDDTLAMNSMYSFSGYHGQGRIYLQVSDGADSFNMYVNGREVETGNITPGGCWMIDISPVAKNGENTLQVSNIVPSDLPEAVKVFIPYPEVLGGIPEDEGIRPEALAFISDLIETDIENGFTSAQLSVIRNGRLVYENAWGRTDSYLPDGTVCTDSAPVTCDTLYDLASITKMFSVNYALQKLVTDGEVDLDSRITDYL